MPYQVKVNFQNACCSPVRRMQIETAMRERMIALSGGVENLKKYHDAPDRKYNPCSHFNRVVRQSERDILEAFDYSPTARKEARFAVLFEVVNA